MKKALVAIAALLVSVSAYAQGQINFNTHVTTDTPAVDAKVFMPDGTTPAGQGAFGQLFIKNGSTYTPLLDVNGGATPFRTSAAGLGYLNGGASTATSPAGSYSIVLRAWSNASSYDAATIRGESLPVTLTLTEAPAIPNDLIGLQGFTMVPEPTTLALGAVGLGALLIRRRKA
jgi:hypothetical protein